MTTQPVLVTGAAGFIGSHVAAALLARGQRVIGVDNFDPFYDRAAKERNLSELGYPLSPRRADSAFEFHELDITDATGLGSLMQRTRPEGVIHLAAKAGVRPSIQDPVGYSKANVLATSVILEEARKAECSRVVVASSSSVYGNSPTAPFSETQDVNQPISPYAATKKACELIGYTHWHLTKQPVAMLRFFTVFGPRQRPDLAINLFMRKICAGDTVQLFGDGTSRDYTFIDDIVSGVLASYDRIPQYGYRVWNLGGNHPIGLDEMVNTIAKVVGQPAKIERGPMRPGDVQRTWADLTRATAELDYQPKTPFEEGVGRQWAWMKSVRA
ncbi:MAG TPA: GDP-mannose 4,6-dehydratase [Phycisphaerales bacterium]|nr:GDP-mannose 4,6-dehydratase [Phycisphaerales bacterium]